MADLESNPLVSPDASHAPDHARNLQNSFRISGLLSQSSLTDIAIGRHDPATPSPISGSESCRLHSWVKYYIIAHGYADDTAHTINLLLMQYPDNKVQFCSVLSNLDLGFSYAKAQFLFELQSRKGQCYEDTEEEDDE
jgi:hypothetical protein